MPGDDPSVWDDGPQYPEIWDQPVADPAQPAVAPPPLPVTPVSAPPIVPTGDGDDGEGRSERRALLIGGIVVGLIALGVLVWLVASGGDGDTDLAETGTVPTLPVTPPPTVATTLSVITSPPATTPPATTQPETTQPATTQPATTQPATTQPATTQPATTQPETTPAPDGPVVNITSAVGPCNFGSDCLIAGFTIERFDAQPTEFICEFADGSRYPFRFDSDGVEYACATGSADATITIEVAGVRSETVSRP